MASANPHKVQQMVDLMADLLPGIEVLARPTGLGGVVEDADTLLGNARLKAEAVCQATGQASVADDTGLFVDALDGLPGVHTAYYAGPANDARANNAKLLSELARVGALDVSQRGAAFRTIAFVRLPNGLDVIGEGVIRGHIAQTPRGDGGFGYDPLFVPEGDSETLAEMSYARKQQLSHRFRAFADLAAKLREAELV
jgi:XTP/dITP diphosphohydrolase